MDKLNDFSRIMRKYIIDYSFLYRHITNPTLIIFQEVNKIEKLIMKVIENRKMDNIMNWIYLKHLWLKILLSTFKKIMRTVDLVSNVFI